MGGCLVTEGAVLMQWCEKNGFGPFILTGLSMGGHVKLIIILFYLAIFF